MILAFNPAAFKHGFTEMDVEAAMATALVDELIEEFNNKFLLIGFSMNGNLLEVMYNLVDEDIANIFHVMRCRKEFLQKLPEGDDYADFN
jgi:hypothetical protein